MGMRPQLRDNHQLKLEVHDAETAWSRTFDGMKIRGASCYRLPRLQSAQSELSRADDRGGV